MADSRVVFEVVVEGKNIKVVQKQVQDLGKSIDKTAASQKQGTKASSEHTAAMDNGSRAAGHFNRGQKGVAHATNNGTKAFSKQRDAISGSSGLVGAYATLAANMFAATALFNAFRGAAQVEQLTEGMTQLGYQSGLAMKTIATGLQEATDGAVSLEQAMRSTVQITSAGLDPSAVIRFGEAARNASIALGRNLGDTIDRLTRGVTKLEPELLDELGIFIRIDEVTSQYAATVGKTANQLTSFEKRIAFQNAALTQLEQKFSAVGDSVDVNPYDRLAAAFSNLGNTMAGFAASGLAPIVEFLAARPLGLLSVLTLIGGKVIKQAISSFGAFTYTAEQQEKVIKQLGDSLLDYQQDMDPTTEAERELFKALEDGTLSIGHINKAMQQVSAQTAEHQGYVDNLVLAQQKYDGQLNAGLISQEKYDEKTKSINDTLAVHKKIIAENDLSMRAYTQTQAQFGIQAAKTNSELAAQAFAQHEWSRGFALAKGAIKDQIGEIKSYVKNIINFKNAITAAKLSVKLFTDTVKLAGIALLSAVPIIGQVMFAVQLLIDGFKFLRDVFRTDEAKAFSEQLSSLEDTMKELSGTFGGLNASIANNSAHLGGIVKRYEALGNAAKQAQEELQKLEFLPGGDISEISEQYNELFEKSADLQKAYIAVKRESGLIKVSDAQRLELQKEALENVILASDQVRALKSAGEGATKAFTDFRNAVRIKNEFTDTANSLDILVEGLKSAEESLKVVGDGAADSTAKTIEAVLDSIPDKEILLQIGVDSLSIAKVKTAKEDLDVLKSKLNELKTERDDLPFFHWTADAKKLNNEIRETEKAIKAAGLAGRDLTANIRDQIQQRQIELKRAELALAVTKKNIETQDQVTARLKENKSLNEESTRAIIASENEVLRLQQSLNEALIIDLETRIRRAEWAGEFAAKSTQQLAMEAELARLRAQNAATAAKYTGESEIQVELAKNKVTLVEEEQKFVKSLLDVTKKQLDYAKQSREALTSVLRSQLELNAARSERGLNYREQIILANVERDNKIAAANEAAAIKKAEIDLEYALLNVKFALLEAELNAAHAQKRLMGDSYKIATDALAKAKGILQGSTNNEVFVESARIGSQILLESTREAGDITTGVYNDIQNILTGIKFPTIEMPVDPNLASRKLLLDQEVMSATEAGNIIKNSYNDAVKVLSNIDLPAIEDPSLDKRVNLLASELDIARKAGKITEDSYYTAAAAIEAARAMESPEDPSLTTRFNLLTAELQTAREAGRITEESYATAARTIEAARTTIASEDPSLDRREELLNQEVMSATEAGNIIENSYSEAARILSNIDLPTIEDPSLDKRFDLLTSQLNTAKEAGKITEDSYYTAAAAIEAARAVESPEDPSLNTRFELLTAELQTAREAGRITEESYATAAKTIEAARTAVAPRDSSLDERFGLTVEEVRAAREAGQILETSASVAASTMSAITLPEDPSTQDRLNFLEQYLNTAIQVKGITREAANEFLRILNQVKEPKSLPDQAKDAVNAETEGTVKTATNEADIKILAAKQRERDLDFELAMTLADMQDEMGTTRVAQILQEGTTLQGVYKQLGESQTADILRRAALEERLQRDLAIADAEKNKPGGVSKEVALRIAKTKKEIEKLNADQRAMAISMIEAQADLYRASGQERLAFEQDLGALKAQIAWQEVLIKQGGNAEAEAELDRLFARLQELKKAQTEFSVEAATRTGGKQAGDFAAVVGAGIQGAAEGGIFEDGKIALSADTIAYLSDATQGLREGLEEIGGDGPLMASVVNGAFAVGEAWTHASEVLAKGGDKWQEKMQQGAAIASAVGATISAIGNIQAAASDKRIEALEGEIEAEKKRDGKSEQSKAKIRALEAKVEKEKRKAFEQDKKMKMASTIMNTAAGIMQALGSIPPPASFVMAALIGVMGAMQLAAIASTSYQGGGAAPSGPTAISLGERSSTIDLAKSKSASGEIGYMRGESGVGGINEFKPAFTGIRHRAAGGATAAYMVGEQGPELFVPNKPGTIVPNDEVSQLTPTQNVNFTIQAVDTDGVEQLLVKQKGHIIRMIRDAANSYGTPFLEEVNVGVYTPQAGGASRA